MSDGAKVRCMMRADICMPVPVPIEGVPPGLECLSMVDRIKIKQLVEIVEVISGFETKNKYALKNASGQQVYYAFEESDCCERVCCGPNRGFTIHIVDNYGRIGKVEQRGAFCASSFVIKDQNDRVIFQIYGPLCCFMCGCHDKEFPDFMEFEQPGHIVND
ncbi:Scramblase [Ancylostoma ceylanicum]|uniref:Phospholipid scramblase n=1 Tax=Ancylostoma ceylanicum TaxID=53326 RepID=A0A0D6LDQ6_9BILA|nr:Scramblase [Ancylostoma ceylanicum]